jgi:hydrogenase maturation protease
MAATTTLVLGIGNTLLSDEGAGIHALEFLRRHHPDLPGVTYLDGGTLSFTLADPIAENDNLIVLDAAQLGADPGTVRSFEGADMDDFLGTNKRSAHEVGLLDLLAISALSEHLPRRRALIGIQPEHLDWGDGPTESVAGALPQVAATAVELIRGWCAGTRS